MDFSQLLSKLFDKVNLGQMLVDGGPGVLLALAMLLLVCQSIPEDSRSTIPFLKLVVKDDLRHTREEIKEFEEKAAGLAGHSARDDQDQANLMKRIGVAEQGRVRLMEGSPCAPGSLCFMYEALASIREDKAKTDKEVEFVGKRLDELRAKLETRKKEYVRDGRVLLSELVSLTLGLSVFGYILGTLFSGLNYSVWVLAAQRAILRTLGRAWEWLRLRRAASPVEMAKIALQGHMRMMELRLGTAVVIDDKEKTRTMDRLMTAIAAKGKVEKNSTIGIKGIREQIERMKGPKALPMLPVTYYVGRGIISQQDYDGFITRYFRWVEAAANLIFPVLVLGYALQCIQDERNARGPSDALVKFVTTGRLSALLHKTASCLNWLNNHPLVWAIVLAVLLYIAAQLLYSDYKRRLRDFIKGKLYQKKLDDEKNAKKPPTNGDKPAPKPAPQKLEIIIEGDQMTTLIKLLEQCLQGKKA